MNIGYLLLASAVVTVATRALYSDRILPDLSPAWRARAAFLLGVLGAGLSALVEGRPWHEAAVAGLLVGSSSIGIYELDKGRAAPLLKKPAELPPGGA
jgi:hypothetical protein